MTTPKDHFSIEEIPYLLEARRGDKKNIKTVRDAILRGNLVADFIDLAGHQRFYERTVLKWYDTIRGRGRPKRVKGTHRKRAAKA